MQMSEPSVSGSSKRKATKPQKRSASLSPPENSPPEKRFTDLPPPEQSSSEKGFVDSPPEHLSIGQRFATDFYKQMLVTFDYEYSHGVDFIGQATIHYPERNWRWYLNVRDFNSIFNLTRILDHWPGRLATIQALKRGEFRHESGQYQIKILDDLLSSFITRYRASRLCRQILTSNGKLQILFGLNDIPEDSGEDLNPLLDDFQRRLRQIHQTIRYGSLPVLDQQIQELLRLADDASLACNTFIDLVYPIWRKNNRLEFVGKEDIDRITNNCKTKLNGLREKLTNAYLNSVSEFAGNHPAS